MRVTIFIGGLSGGGAERVACSLASFLAKNSNEVTLLTITNNKDSYPVSPEVHISSLTPSMPLGILKNIVRTVRLILYLLFKKQDVYVAMLPRPTYMILKLRRFTKAKIIAAQRVMPSSLKKETQKMILDVSGFADAWTFQTKEQYEWFKTNGANVTKYSIIPNAINDEFLAIKNSSPKEKIITASGRLTAQKNHRLLITAFSKIYKRFPDYTLNIYGEGPLLEELSNLANSLGLRDKVNFKGYTTDIIGELQKSSLYILSSDYEGMPNALMEAMALGLPCVSTDCKGGGAKFLIEDGINGILVPVGEVEPMAEAMDKLLSDTELREGLGNNARTITERLSADKIYDAWEKFLIKTVKSENVC